MDPIMKLLEDDEDESLHSGADVEAFTAALNREVEASASSSGTVTAPPAVASSSSLPTDHGAALLPQENKSLLNHGHGQWQDPASNETANQGSQQQEQAHLQRNDQPRRPETVSQGSDSKHPSNTQKECELVKVKQEPANSSQQGIVAQQQPMQQMKSEETQIVAQQQPKQQMKSEQAPIVAQQPPMQQMKSQQIPIVAQQQPMQQMKSQQPPIVAQQQPMQMKSQQTPHTNQTNGAATTPKAPVVAFHMLLPMLRRYIDKDKDMQVQSNFAKLRKNEVSKEHFLKVVRNIVGDKVLKLALSEYQIQMQVQSSVQAPPAAVSKTPQRKASGQKKPLEALGSSPPPSSKKQKTSGGFHEQSIDQLNDVTAVSGVNLREEEEQLFSAPKEEIFCHLFSDYGILAVRKCNLKVIGADVERCLSMGDSNANTDLEKDKNETRASSKHAKTYKEDDDKMRTTAANVAARVAAGGDDMLSKWQLLAERNKQRSEGGDGSSGSIPGGVRRSPLTKVARSVSVKDVIAALEREPQMSKSSLLFRLYRRPLTEPAAK
nr:unnamed protein product [Digitaria exilis]